MERQKEKFEKLWQKTTGGHSNIQNCGDGKIQIQMNGTTVKPNEEPGTTQTTTTTPVNNNNRMKWVHNLSKTP